MGNGNWCIHLSQLLARIRYATGENSLGLVIVIVNSLPPNFVPPVAADRTADPGGHLRREGASDGLSSNQVGRLSSSDCRCQHDALVYLKSADLLPKKMVHAKKKRSAACAKKIIFCLGLELAGAACMQKRDGFDRAGSKVNGAKKQRSSPPHAKVHFFVNRDRFQEPKIPFRSREACEPAAPTLLPLSRYHPRQPWMKAQNGSRPQLHSYLLVLDQRKDKITTAKQAP